MHAATHFHITNKKYKSNYLHRTNMDPQENRKNKYKEKRGRRYTSRRSTVVSAFMQHRHGGEGRSRRWILVAVPRSTTCALLPM